MVDVTRYMGVVFVKVGDVKAAPGGVIRATIVGVEESDRYDKLNAELSNGMTLSLNTTNTTTLALAYGTNSDLWIGKEIELYVGQVEFQGKAQEAVLVRPISPKIEQKVKPKKKLSHDLDDEIPM